MHNIDITKLLQHYINTFDLKDIDEDTFFTLNQEAKLITTLWYLISLTNHTNLNINELTTLTKNSNYTTALTDILNKLSSLSVNVNNLDDVKDYTNVLDTIATKLNTLNNTDFTELLDNTFNTKVTNTVDVNLTNNKVLVDNLIALKDILLTTKLDDSTITKLLTPTITNKEFKITNLVDLINSVLTVKLIDNKVEVTNLNNSTKVNNLNEIITSTLNTKVTNLSELTNISINNFKDLLANTFTVKLNSNEVKVTNLAETTLNTKVDSTVPINVKLTNDVSVNNLSSLFNALTIKNTSFNVSNLSELTNLTLTTKLLDNKVIVDNTKISNFNDLTVLTLNTKVSNFADILNAVLNVKLDTSNLTTLTTNSYKLAEDTLNSLVSKLVVNVLTTKVNNLNELSTIPLTFKNTELRVNNLNDLSNLVLTTKLSDNNVKVGNLNDLSNIILNINDTNRIVPKIITETQLTVNGNTSTIDITYYNTVSYIVNISSLISIVNLSLMGSLDETNWYLLPITYTNLMGSTKDNVVTVATNTIAVLNSNCSSKFIRLNVSGLSLGTKINSKVYLK